MNSNTTQFIDSQINSPKVAKITFIGPGGKIGRLAISKLCETLQSNQKIEMVLIGSGSEDSLIRINAFIKRDLFPSLFLLGVDNRVSYKITNDYREISNSDIIICTAGKWPPKEQNEELKDRMAQSYLNKNMIIDITNEIIKYCPSSLMIIVTNQTDHMCKIARQLAPNMNILGLSGAVDSTRFQYIMKDNLGIECEGFIIGYHNKNMFPLLNSIKSKEDGRLIFPLLSQESIENENFLDRAAFDEEEKKLNKVMNSVKKAGYQIYLEQRAGIPNAEPTGASDLPATAIVKAIKAYCFGEQYVESWNICIKDRNVADFYGVEVNDELSIPVRLSEKSISILTEISPTKKEKNKLNKFKEELNNDVKLILEH